jgi:hypothetical protein
MGSFVLQLLLLVMVDEPDQQQQRHCLPVAWHIDIWAVGTSLLGFSWWVGCALYYGLSVAVVWL